jgi:hypothetical protein
VGYRTPVRLPATPCHATNGPPPRHPKLARAKASNPTDPDASRDYWGISDRRISTRRRRTWSSLRSPKREDVRTVRVRTIPLVDDAVWADNSLVSRARQLGSVETYHFLFPYKHGNRPYDPTRHMADNGVQKRWNDLRRAAGMPWITGHVCATSASPRWPRAGSTGLQQCEWQGTSPTRCGANTLKCAWIRCDRS